MVDLSRRAVIGALGATAVGTALSWPRLTGQDIPGRGEDVLTICLFGTAQDAAARTRLVAAFRERHPDIRVQIRPIQGVDWSDFLAKILTLVAAGTPPDLVLVATEGTQLFAERLGEPLDSYVRRDAEELRGYFADVHPALVESFMYQGSLFQLPNGFNAANLYYNSELLRSAGLDRPADDWTVEDFRRTARTLTDAAGPDFRAFFWTNRLWGGVVPWLYVNDTSILSTRKVPGGDWLWSEFYPDETGRGGGFAYESSSALDPRVEESFAFLSDLTAEGLGSSPAQGGGSELVSRFARGHIGMTPAGGFWMDGLFEGGMSTEQYDVCYFPRMRSQRHQFGADGYAIMRESTRKDAAWEWIKFCLTPEAVRLAIPTPNTTPARRSVITEDWLQGRGPKHWKVFYDTLDKFGDTAPIPAPPNQAAVETAMIKHVQTAVTGPRQNLRTVLAAMDRDLTRALRSSS